MKLKDVTDSSASRRPGPASDPAFKVDAVRGRRAAEARGAPCLKPQAWTGTPELLVAAIALRPQLLTCPLAELPTRPPAGLSVDYCRRMGELRRVSAGIRALVGRARGWQQGDPGGENNGGIGL